MNHIKVLHDQFQLLDINEKNFYLYERLLDLDISDFKPIMEEILLGRLDIEDTRPILLNNFSIDSKEEDFNPYIKDNDEVLRNNIINRLTSNDGKGIIKENIIPITNFDDFKTRVVSEFREQVKNELISSDFEFTDEDIASIIVIADKEFRQSVDWNASKKSFDQRKSDQINSSNLLSFKPRSKV